MASPGVCMRARWWKSQETGPRAARELREVRTLSLHHTASSWGLSVKLLLDSQDAKSHTSPGATRAFVSACVSLRPYGL